MFVSSPTPPAAERRGCGTNAAWMGMAGQWPGAPSLTLAALSVGVGTAPTLPVVETEPQRPTVHRRHQQLRAPLAVAISHPFSSLAHASSPPLGFQFEEKHRPLRLEHTMSPMNHSALTLPSLLRHYRKKDKSKKICNYLIIKGQRKKSTLK